MLNEVPQVSIIIPVYDEAATIAKTLKVLNCLVNVPHEVVIVYDSDDDSTVPVVKQLQGQIPTLRLQKNIYGPGVVNAIKTGFRMSRCHAVCIYTADFTDQPEAIDAMYAEIQRGFDVVSGARYIPGGQKYGGPWLQTKLSRIGNWLFQALTDFPLSDITYSFKMYRRGVLEAIEIEYDAGWVISFEISVQAYLKGFRFTEIPAVWIARQLGESKFSLGRWLPAYLRWFGYGVWTINAKRFFNRSVALPAKETAR